MRVLFTAWLAEFIEPHTPAQAVLLLHALGPRHACEPPFGPAGTAGL